jgi:hypothetical protein
MRAALRPNNSMGWPPNPLHRQGQLLLHDLLSKICDKTAGVADVVTAVDFARDRTLLVDHGSLQYFDLCRGDVPEHYVVVRIGHPWMPIVIINVDVVHFRIGAG